MSVSATETKGDVASPANERIVNDVVIEVATANGSGSQSANMILMRAIFRMGIPVSGKNLFPSNIQGLPTWFTIRANQDGWLARRPNADFLIVMNAETAADDLEAVRPGAHVVLNESLKGYLKREDLNVSIVPFDKLVAGVVKGILRKKVVNIVYTGVMAYLLDIGMEYVDIAVDHQFGGKKKAADVNKEAARVGYAWAAENLEKPSDFTLTTCEAAKGKIIIEGNEATAIGMVFGGVTVAGWYPITPSSSVCEHLQTYMDKYRRDPENGKATYAIVQAEDELASMAIVVGAGWGGARSFTATSGPGISLMAELAGLSYFAEIPAVIVNVQRMGPSTGLPTRTCQGDIASAYNLSHGDCQHPLLLAGSVEECYTFAAEALNLAEELQTLVFLMTDLDLGMNSWIADEFKPLEGPIKRGKVLTAEDLDANSKYLRDGQLLRYADLDGDGVGYRTLPGTNHPSAAYFTRGTGHTDAATYSEKPEDWKDNMDRLVRKFDFARDKLPQPIVENIEGAEIGIIAYGSSGFAVQEARDMLEKTHGVKTNYLRLRALPFNDKTVDFINSQRITYVVEQNRDAQVASIIRGEHPELAMKIATVLHYNGLPLDALTIVDQTLAHESKENA